MCATILRENNFAEPTLWKAQLCRTETLDNWVKFGNLSNNFIEKFLKNCHHIFIRGLMFICKILLILPLHIKWKLNLRIFYFYFSEFEIFYFYFILLFFNEVHCARPKHHTKWASRSGPHETEFQEVGIGTAT